eukprot:8578794-Lingulodinium_polyedra.AAC.1
MNKASACDMLRYLRCVGECGRPRYIYAQHIVGACCLASAIDCLCWALERVTKGPPEGAALQHKLACCQFLVVRVFKEKPAASLNS